MPTLGNTPRPAYVYDTETDTWVPVGVGAHTHDTLYVNQNVIDAKGDLLVGTADNAYSRLGKGADGTVLVADNTTSTGLAWQPYGAQVVAGKNAIINGGFDFWQRGTTITSTSGFLNSSYLSDRWYLYYYGGGNTSNYTASQQAQTPGAIPGCETPFYIRHAFPAGNATSYWETFNRIEDVRTFAGQTVTISFWIRNSGTQGIAPNIELIQNFGTGGSTAVYYYPGTPPITSSWSRYTLTTTLGSVSGKTIGANSYLQFKLYWGPTAGAFTAFNVDIAGVQIELGPVATPFSRAGGTIAGELAACQRYYFRQTNPISNNYTVLGSGFGASTTTIKGQIKLPQTMRVAPSSVEHSGVYAWDGVNLIGSLSGLALEYSNENYLNFTSLTAGGSFTQFRPYTILLSYPGQYIACSAEL